ncbi:8689_t:CDS:2 [Paraglomus occultum]|uniref:8689_t:CDS:1 n=1 Tax=Paraglomus occultum TaxID=144539 RepID=A0A9N9F405_9GLOM|nr:8689_t:CDS:2 [Paraglomus occultum]
MSEYVTQAVTTPNKLQSPVTFHLTILAFTFIMAGYHDSGVWRGSNVKLEAVDSMGVDEENTHKVQQDPPISYSKSGDTNTASELESAKTKGRVRTVKISHLIEAGLLSEGTQVICRGYRASVTARGTLAPIIPNSGAELPSWITRECKSPHAFDSVVNRLGKPGKKVSANGWKSIKVPVVCEPGFNDFVNSQDTSNKKGILGATVNGELLIPLDAYRIIYEKHVEDGWTSLDGPIKFDRSMLIATCYSDHGVGSDRKTKVNDGGTRGYAHLSKLKSQMTTNELHEGINRRTARTMSLETGISLHAMRNRNRQERINRSYDAISHKRYAQQSISLRRHSSPAATSRPESHRQRTKTVSDQSDEESINHGIVRRRRKKIKRDVVLASLDDSLIRVTEQFQSVKVVQVSPFITMETVPILIQHNTGILFSDICFGCGGVSNQNDPADQMVHCIRCGEAYHWYCGIESSYGRNIQHTIDPSSWECPRCKICLKCQQPIAQLSPSLNRLNQHRGLSYRDQLPSHTILECSECGITLHCECQKQNEPYVDLSIQESRGIWNDNTSASDDDMKASDHFRRWTHEYRLCSSCSYFEACGNVCYLCRKLYRSDDYDTPMVKCDGCLCWIHQECDQRLAAIDYEALGDDENQKYFCPLCLEEPKNKNKRKQRMRDQKDIQAAKVFCSDYSTSNVVPQSEIRKAGLASELPSDKEAAELLLAIGGYLNNNNNQNESMNQETSHINMSVNQLEQYNESKLINQQASHTDGESISWQEQCTNNGSRNQLTQYAENDMLIEEMSTTQVHGTQHSDASANQMAIDQLCYRNGHTRPTLSASHLLTPTVDPPCVFCSPAQPILGTGRLIPFWMDDGDNPQSSVQYWAHVLCLLYSKNVMIDLLDGGLINVQKVIRESRNKNCDMCRQPFATVECHNAWPGSTEDCANKTWHFSCIIAYISSADDTNTSRRFIFKQEKWEVFCGEHCDNHSELNYNTRMSDDAILQRFYVRKEGKSYNCDSQLLALPRHYNICESFNPQNIPGTYRFGALIIRSIGEFPSDGPSLFDSSFEHPIPYGFHVERRYMDPITGKKYKIDCQVVASDGTCFNLRHETRSLTFTEELEEKTEVVVRYDKPESALYGWKVAIMEYDNSQDIIYPLGRYKLVDLSQQSSMKGNVFGASDDNSNNDYDCTYVSARTESRSKKTMRRIRRVGACCHLQIVEKEDNSYDVIIDRQRANNNRLLTSRLIMNKMDAMILEEQYYSMKKTEARDTIIESIRCREQDSDTAAIRRRTSGSVPAHTITVNKTERIKHPPTDFGVFAQRSFEKDDMILEYTGMVMNTVNARLLESSYARQQRSCYMMWGDADWVIDASRRGGKARFVSSVDNGQGNTYAMSFKIGSKRKIALFAARHIDAHEQITFRYAISSETEAVIRN